MTEAAPSRRPRRKQAVPVKYEFSDDSDSDFVDDTIACEIPSTSKEGCAAPKPEQSLATGEKPKLLLRIKIKNSSSSEAYVEHASQQEDHDLRDTTRARRRCTVVQPSPVTSLMDRLKRPVYSMGLKKYETFPKSFRVEAVRHAQEHGIEHAAKHFAVPLSKIKMWMKSRTFEKALKKSGRVTLRHASRVSKRQEPQSWGLYAPAFKLFAIRLADEKGAKEAAALLSLDEGMVEEWSRLKEDITRKALANGSPQWETDVFVGIRRDLLAGHEVRVEDLLERAGTLKVDNTLIGMDWMRQWCTKFNVSFRDPILQGKGAQKEVSKVTQLQLPTELTSLPSEQEGREKQVQVNKRAAPKRHNIPRLSRGSTKIDFELWKWCRSLEQKGKKMTKAIVCARAQHMFSKHGYADFRAGDGWYRAWKSRCQVLDSKADAEKGGAPSTNTNEHAGSNSSENSAKRETINAENGMKERHKEEEVAGSLTFSEREDSSNVFGAASSPLSCHPSEPLHTTYKPSDRTCIEPLVLLMDCDSGSGPHEVKPEAVCDPYVEQHHPQFSVHNPVSFASYWGDGSVTTNRAFNDCSHQSHPIAPFHESFLPRGFAQSSMEHPRADGGISALPYEDDGGLDDYEASMGSHKKKNERYLPEFKLQVVKYALQTTFKKTAERFGVHHSTVAEWCRDREKLERLFPQEKGTLSKGGNEPPSPSPPELAFLEWLQNCNIAGQQIVPTDVKDKVKEIIDQFGEGKVESTCRWLYVWHKKRLEMQQMIEDDVTDLSESSGKETRIAFPPAVKLEIVRVAERQKFSDTAKCFQIDRNSLSDWSKAQTKLQAMVKEGKVRKKEVSKSPKALEAELEVFKWYQQCRSNGYKPGPQEVRAIAAETYRKHGDMNMKCSIGWYSRWSRRFGIQLRYEKDEEILEWVLTQLEQNRTITHHDIQVRAIEALSQTRTGFKCSAGWPIRFCKRHQALLQQQPKLDTPLPGILEEKVNSFRQQVQQLQERHSFTNAAIGAMDEIPLCFTSPVSGGGALLIRRCGLESAHAVVLLSCLADGAILPPLVLLKGSNYNESINCGFVLHQEDMRVDMTTMDYWAIHLWSRYVPSPSLLLLDCFEPHAMFAASAGDVKVAIMPGGCTSQLHPVTVWLRRKFQALVQSAWLQSGSTRTVPSPRETLDCITSAWQRLQGGVAQDAVRNSFTITGAVLAADHSEDHLLGKASLLPDVEEVDASSLV